MNTLLQLPPEASTFAHGIDLLHEVIFLVSLLGCLGVVATSVLFILRYRRGRAAVRDKRPDDNTPLLAEIGVIGFITWLFVTLWVIGFRQYDEIENPPDDAIVVHVTAQQWVWKFEHASGETELGTLTVPVNVPVKLVMISRDVILSFFVPAFRVKQDVLPGRYTTMWFQATTPGDYPVYCAELCGVGHSAMSATVHVVAAPPPAQSARHILRDGAPR
jgi:cytochrome c oxidase subunit 2